MMNHELGNFDPRYRGGSREAEMAEIGMAVAVGAAGMIGLRPSSKKALAHSAWRKYALSLIPGHSARTPKAEKIFKDMIRKGSAIVVRRRGKPPLLKRVVQKS